MKPEDQPTGGLNVHKRRFDVMQVCPLEGSTITAWFHTHPETRAKCCPDCGAETINQCPSCGEEIRGADLTSGYLGKPDPPRCCVQCGSKFPWTERVSAHELAVTRPHQDPLRTIRTIVERFRQFALQLERRQQRRPPISIKDEYDVQDLLHAVLRLFFDDVRTEEFTPSYASAASRMDFLLKKERIVIEVKMTRKGLDSKELGRQLIEDIAHYRVHPDCATLVCFAYDPGDLIHNARGIESDLSGHRDGLDVHVLVVSR